MHVRKGDNVEVLSGNDRGKHGEVKQTFPKEGRVIVEGVNLRWRHKKPTQNNPKGERVQSESPIHSSNVRVAETSGTKKDKAKKAKSEKAAKAKQ